MDDIFEEFGGALFAALTGAIIIGIITVIISQTGILSNLALDYAYSIGG